jgi:hypothetical protein
MRLDFVSWLGNQLSSGYLLLHINQPTAVHFTSLYSNFSWKIYFTECYRKGKNAIELALTVNVFRSYVHLNSGVHGFSPVLNLAVFVSWLGSRGWPRPFYRWGFEIKFRHTTLGRTSLDEWPAHLRDLYLTTHNTHKRQTSMPAGGL